MMDERYRLFLLCAQTLHFTRAGEMAFRTQSAVSQSMAALESELGFLLFHRDRRHLRLTEAGLVLHRYCREAAERDRALATELENLNELISGGIRMGASATTAGYWLPAPLTRFRRRYSGLELSLATGPTEAVLRWVMDGDCDLGLVTLPAQEPALLVFPLQRREDILIAAPGSGLVPRPPRIADLDGVPFVAADTSTRTRGFLDTVFREAGVQPRIVLEVRSLEMAKRYVQQDFGVSIVPRWAVDAEVRHGELEAWPLFPPEQFRTLALVIPARRPLGRAAEALATHLREHAASGATGPEPERGQASRAPNETPDRES